MSIAVAIATDLEGTGMRSLKKFKICQKNINASMSITDVDAGAPLPVLVAPAANAAAD